MSPFATAITDGGGLGGIIVIPEEPPPTEPDPTGITDLFNRGPQSVGGTSDAGLVWADFKSAFGTGLATLTVDQVMRLRIDPPTGLNEIGEQISETLDGAVPPVIHANFDIRFDLKMTAQNMSIVTVTPFWQVSYGTGRVFLEMGGVDGAHGQRLFLFASGKSGSTSTPYTMTTGTRYHVRFALDYGSEMRVKFWTGATEPGTWDLTRSLTGQSSSSNDHFNLNLVNQGSTLIDLNSLVEMELDNLDIPEYPSL